MEERKFDIDDNLPDPDFVEEPFEDFLKRIRASKNHKTAEELIAEQGTRPFSLDSLPESPFEPGEVEEFLEAVREWRGHKRHSDLDAA